MGMGLTCCSSEAGWGPGRGGPAPVTAFPPGEKRQRLLGGDLARSIPLP